MTDDDLLRAKLKKILSGGLETEWKDRAYDSETINKLIYRLKQVAPNEYEQKLVISGFTIFPYEGESEIIQSCETCMYYLRHRRYCELPELDLPVEPEWSCTLWRI